ncbi:MAG: sensor histidine kinase [Lachnospiraceae bacterium]|nr:sensor histidine kinase [Lachnospiraceae bacterium]
MSDSVALTYIRTVMKNLNLLLILWISGIVCLTTYKIVEAFEAEEFMKQVGTIPIEPWKVPLISVIAFLLLVAVMSMKRWELQKDLHFIIYSILEVILCLIIMRALDFNYNSIVLLIIADLLTYWKNTKFRISVIVLLFLLYIITDIAIYQNVVQIIPIDAYLTYYSTDARMIITGTKSVLNSCNILLFMFYMVLLIRVQRMENERILELNKKLDEANVQLKLYALKTEKMTETRERNRLAREIHDTLGHALTGIIAGIDACKKLIDFSTDETKEQLEAVAEVARSGMKDVRRSVKALRPDALEKFSLEEAINQVIKEMSNVSGAEINLENIAGKLEFQEDEEETIYRIVQESLTNAIRHGNADKIQIKIERMNNLVIVNIKDNGIGCENIEKGFGLRHMSERLELLNGELRYDGVNGFTVMAKIPIRWGRAE